jgi:uncharacterized protein
MNPPKLNFFLKLNPPRQSFTVDMTEDERNIMLKHIAYWTPYVKDGTMLVYGPVMDPKSGYGIGIIAVDSEEQLKQLLANDPASSVGSYEYYPMRAVTKESL